MKKVANAFVVSALIFSFFGCSKKDESVESKPVKISISEVKKSGAKNDITSMEELAESVKNLQEDPFFTAMSKMLSYVDHAEKDVYLAAYSSRRKRSRSSYDSESRDWEKFLLKDILGEDFQKKAEKFSEDMSKNKKASIDYSRKEKVLFKAQGIEIKDYYLMLDGFLDDIKKCSEANFKLKFAISVDPKEIAEDSGVKDLILKFKTNGSYDLRQTSNDKVDGKADFYASAAAVVSFVDPKTERGGILSVSFSIEPSLTAKRVMDAYESKNPNELAKKNFDYVKPVFIIDMKNDDGVSTFRREFKTYEDFENLEKEIEDFGKKISNSSSSGYDYSYGDMNDNSFDYDFPDGAGLTPPDYVLSEPSENFSEPEDYMSEYEYEI